MATDIMPYLVSMTKLSDYTMSTYDRWVEEIEALLALAGLSEVTKGGAKGDEDTKARAILVLAMERDVRDIMGQKMKDAKSAGDLWKAIKAYQTDYTLAKKAERMASPASQHGTPSGWK